jgi:pimeloyl-ACP methyl ester carboxylesterase
VDDIIDEFELVDVKGEVAMATFTPNDVNVNGDLCSLAYSNLDANREATPTDIELALFETELSTVYARAKGCNVTLTYKGTSTRRDLASDFNALPTFTHALLPHLAGYLHRGFLEAFASTWPQVEAFLEAFAAKQGLTAAKLSYTLTGHSLGGAQATLASLRLAELVDSPSTQLRQVTFGSPRVMSVAGATAFNELMGARTLRVAENGVDIVTMVAPGFLGFKHVGLNLAVEKPAGVLPHLMSGYMAGVAKLNTNTFVPTFLGTRRAFFNSLRRLISRS